MSATATPDAYGYPPRRERRWRDEAGHDHRRAGRWSPWTAPKGVLIAAMVLGFIVFFPIGLMILGFMIGAGRIGKRWARRYGMEPGSPDAGSAWAAWSCGSRGRSSGNAAFDEYREDTLRRLEEEQKDFAAYLERLRFAKDRAEFEQFMTERRPRPPAEPQEG
jgi:hypothetical protein